MGMNGILIQGRWVPVDPRGSVHAILWPDGTLVIVKDPKDQEWEVIHGDHEDIDA